MKILLLSFIVIILVLSVSHDEIIVHIKHQSVNYVSIINEGRTQIVRKISELKNQSSIKIKDIISSYKYIKYHYRLRLNGNNTNRVILLNEALKWQGTKYRYGGTSKRYGTDCSGFVQSVFQTQSVLLPRTANTQFILSKSYRIIYPDFGDVVYFYSEVNGTKVTHCGIILSGQQFIHASQGRKRVIVSLLTDPYYRKRIAGFRRFIL